MQSGPMKKLPESLQLSYTGKISFWFKSFCWIMEYIVMGYTLIRIMWNVTENTSKIYMKRVFRFLFCV